jgi:hypothetical protein
VVTTDEATSTPGMRVARMAAFAPLIAAIAALSIVSHARSRGELRAVECLGVAPWRAARGASLAALIVGGSGIVVLMTPYADAASLFPLMRSAVDWTIDPSGDVAHSLGVLITSDGRIALMAQVAETARVRPAAWAALPSLAPLALAVSPWTVTPMAPALRLASVVAAGMTTVFCLHLIAAARCAPMVGVTAAIPLVVATLLGRARG